VYNDKVQLYLKRKVIVMTAVLEAEAPTDRKLIAAINAAYRAAHTYACDSHPFSRDGRVVSGQTSREERRQEAIQAILGLVEGALNLTSQLVRLTHVGVLEGWVRQNLRLLIEQYGRVRVAQFIQKGQFA